MTQLNNFAQKYASLAKTRKRAYDRLVLPIDRLKDLRSKLIYSVAALSGFLDIVAVGALSRVEQGIHGLPKITQPLDNLAAEVRSGGREGSVMTVYENDDRAVWRDFRRELISNGFRSDVGQKYQDRIKNYLVDLQSAGLLDEEAPNSSDDESSSSAG